MTTDQITIERLAQVALRLYNILTPVVDLLRYVKHCQAVFDLTDAECTALMELILEGLKNPKPNDGDKDGKEA